MTFKVPNTHRIRSGPYASRETDGNNGAFRLPWGRGIAIASDGDGWEHVSVSFKKRTPTWNEMCRVKDLFWDPDDCVLQYHPPASKYVNYHPYCLHLWRPIGVDCPQPPTYMIGPVGVPHE